MAAATWTTRRPCAAGGRWSRRVRTSSTSGASRPARAPAGRRRRGAPPRGPRRRGAGRRGSRLDRHDARPEVARRGPVAPGATLLNDVSSSLAHVAAEHGAGFVAMHRKGTSRRHAARPALRRRRRGGPRVPRAPRPRRPEPPAWRRSTSTRDRVRQDGPPQSPAPGGAPRARGDSACPCSSERAARASSAISAAGGSPDGRVGDGPAARSRGSSRRLARLGGVGDGVRRGHACASTTSPQPCRRPVFSSEVAA